MSVLNGDEVAILRVPIRQELDDLEDLVDDVCNKVIAFDTFLIPTIEKILLHAVVLDAIGDVEGEELWALVNSEAVELFHTLFESFTEFENEEDDERNVFSGGFDNDAVSFISSEVPETFTWESRSEMAQLAEEMGDSVIEAFREYDVESEHDYISFVNRLSRAYDLTNIEQVSDIRKYTVDSRGRLKITYFLGGETILRLSDENILPLRA